MHSPPGHSHRILVVDDNPPNAALLEHVLLAEGHQVAVAADGVEALDFIAEHPPDLILLDLDLPRLDGYEVCRRVKSAPATRLIPIIIITAQNAFEAKMRAWELGADDFITKPFQCLEVIARCRSLLRIKRLVDERDSAEAVVFAFARVVEAKSPYTHGHSERVASYALALAAQFGLPQDQWETLRKGALLHDIGKISVPDAILDKPQPLTPDEFEIMKQHTLQGARMVESLRSVQDAVPMIRWHHERLDGGGYPDGLFAAAIPLMVRILSVADVFDSLASERPYRGPIPHAQCLQILRRDADSGALDADLVKCFCEVVAAGLVSAVGNGSRSLRASPQRALATAGGPQPPGHDPAASPGQPDTRYGAF
ncbi:MAG: response regulator [Gemmataceae bacterium]|nr:response regulator [Gemmataceae bacterium]MDW8265726.1 response regulator [Gemmataceae bacterium]